MLVYIQEICTELKNMDSDVDNVLEWPFSRQLREVEADKFLLQCHMQSGEFAITSRAQMPACHVNVENHITLVLPLADMIIRHADR